MKKIYLLFLVLVGIASSCTKDFTDYNTDKKNPTAVKGEFLFSSAQKNFADQMASTSVNLNVFKLFAQQWTETTYVDEANYNIFNRKIPDNTFRIFYRDVLTLLNQAETKITTDNADAVEKNKLAIIELMKVFTYHELVNTFGDVPYTEANDIGNISPVYDDAKTIYADLLKRIDTALSNLDDSADSFGSSDLIYGGKVSSWKTFAYSLKLKIAVNQIDEVSAETVYNEVKDKVFSSAADNMLFAYQGTQPNTNPMYVSLIVSGRKDFIPANTLVDMMNDMGDPRRDVYFSNKIDGEYVGGKYGYSNAYANYSHINDGIQAASFPGILMTYSEVQFYLAEAALKYDAGAAEGYYNGGVKASFAFWNATGVDDYLAVHPFVDIHSIAEQSYLAAYTRGDIAYTTYRRLDWPEMNKAPEGETSDGLVPRRFTYPIGEQTLNADNWKAASGKLTGGDDMTSKIFWDKH